MKFFVDTAIVEDIKKANDMGVICGVTTNPSLIAKSGRDFAEVIKEITDIVDGPISGEVKAGCAGHDCRGTRDRKNPSKYGSKDSYDGRRIKSSKTAVFRRRKDKCNTYFFCKSGAACRKGRGYVRIAFPGTLR